MCKANICRLWECVWSGIYCVYLVRGVRQISWCVTGAIKVVALDTAHEQHNDSGFMLISPCLAPSWAAGQFSCQAQPKLRWRIEQDSATALRLLAQVGEKARAGGKKEKPEQGRSWILSSRSLFFVVFFHPLLFSFLSYAFLSFIYRCCRFSFLFFEIVLDLKKKREWLSAEQRRAQEYGEEKSKGEGSVAVFCSGGGKSVEEYMLFVLLPFRGGKEHNICAEYQEANGLYLVCGWYSTLWKIITGQRFVSYCHPSFLVHLSSS